MSMDTINIYIDPMGIDPALQSYNQRRRFEAGVKDKSRYA